MALHALTLGTGLTRLVLDLRDADSHQPSTPRYDDVNVALDAVSNLRQLSDLAIYSENWSSPRVSPAARYNVALSMRSSLSTLSALTGLTSLYLDLPCCESSEQAFTFQYQTEASVKLAWLGTWKQQRAGLLAAVANMPLLVDLAAHGMQLDVRDLAALTSLTSLALKGLLVPGLGRWQAPGPGMGPAVGPGMGPAMGPAQPAVAVGAPGAAAAAGAGAPGAGAAAAPAAAGDAIALAQGPVLPAGLAAEASAAAGPDGSLWPLPPRLRAFSLSEPSPSALARLAPSTEVWFADPDEGCSFTFNLMDMENEGYGWSPRLRPGAVSAFRSAVELVCGSGGSWRDAAGYIYVSADMPEDWALEPPRPAGAGDSASARHSSWLPALGLLQQLLQNLDITKIRLDAADVATLAEHMPLLKRLGLIGTNIPPAALYALATLAHLEELYIGGETRRSFRAWGLESDARPAMVHLGVQAPCLALWKLEMPLIVSLQDGGHHGYTAALLDRVAQELAEQRPGLTFDAQIVQG